MPLKLGFLLSSLLILGSDLLATQAIQFHGRVRAGYMYERIREDAIVLDSTGNFISSNGSFNTEEIEYRKVGWVSDSRIQLDGVHEENEWRFRSHIELDLHDTHGETPSEGLDLFTRQAWVQVEKDDWYARAGRQLFGEFYGFDYSRQYLGFDADEVILGSTLEFDTGLQLGRKSSEDMDMHLNLKIDQYEQNDELVINPVVMFHSRRATIGLALSADTSFGEPKRGGSADFEESHYQGTFWYQGKLGSAQQWQPYFGLEYSVINSEDVSDGTDVEVESDVIEWLMGLNHVTEEAQWTTSFYIVDNQQEVNNNDADSLQMSASISYGVHMTKQVTWISGVKANSFETEDINFARFALSSGIHFGW